MFSKQFCKVHIYTWNLEGISQHGPMSKNHVQNQQTIQNRFQEYLPINETTKLPKTEPLQALGWCYAKFKETNDSILQTMTYHFIESCHYNL